MRIAHVIDYFQPGLGYQETFLAREQIKAGHEVMVITSDRHRKYFYRGNAASSVLGPRIKKHGCGVEHGIPTCRLPVAFEFSERAWIIGLEKKMLDFSPDAVHVHGLATFTSFRVARLAPRLKKQANTVLIVDDHMYPEVSRSRLSALYPLLRPGLSKIAGSADWLIAVSEATKAFMVENYGLDPESVGVIRLGVDTGVFRRDEARRNALRRELGIGDEDVVFIYTGKIVPEKRLDLLFDAGGRLKLEGRRPHILLVGYAMENYLGELFKRYPGVSANARHLNAVQNSELYSYLSAADAAVWPSGHSISFIEAMACSLPLIVSNSAKCAEETRFGNGFCYKEGDAPDLAEKMRILHDSAETRERMGLAARAAVEGYYSWDRINGSFMALYSRPGR
ncbi:MAG: glycosyltransferase family 4 protein [Nitrospiraceae bacterium]|nr:glycosyltransferase family 4 protein [Nitrospiraceae bacterium]